MEKKTELLNSLSQISQNRNCSLLYNKIDLSVSHSVAIYSLTHVHFLHYAHAKKCIHLEIGVIIVTSVVHHYTYHCSYSIIS